MPRRSAASLLEPLHFADGSALPSRLIPGPMEAVTAGAWVSQLTARHWVKSWWTPFLRISTGVPRAARLAAWLRPFLQTGLPVIAQVMGCDATLLADAAHGLLQAGATAVDLNCACPSPAVTGNRAGGECLRHPEWMLLALTRMRQAVGNRPLGIKVRMGWHDPAEFHRCIAPVLRTAAPDFVTVHFRTVEELYRPVPGGLQRLVQARAELPGCILIGSGDLFTPADVIAMVEECGVDAVAPARGMLRNPRLLADCATVLQGGAPPRFESRDAGDFLRGCARDGAPRGFILQMAANIFGKNSPDFRQILQASRPG